MTKHFLFPSEARENLKAALTTDRTFEVSERYTSHHTDAYDIGFIEPDGLADWTLRVCYEHDDEQIKVYEFSNFGLVNTTTFSMSAPTPRRLAQVLAIIDLHLAA